MEYYDLKNKKYIEDKENNSGLVFLYNTIIGRLILKVFISKPVRNFYANYMNSKYSKHTIKGFIKKNKINIEEYDQVEYTSFNDFFTRTINPKYRPIDNGLIAIADSKLLVYKINNASKLKIKNSIYTVEELIQEKTDKFKDGYALVFRLTVDDYHHYLFPDDGAVKSSKMINGTLHTVQPIALKKYKVFHENARAVTFLECDNYGEVCYIEVGAMMIGKITNHEIINFQKGQEKGYFEFGGSTVIMLFEKNKIKINETILENSKNEIETIVKMGERLD